MDISNCQVYFASDLKDYGYTAADLQPFIQVAPSAMTELVHWQNQGYALITPNITDKIFSIEEIR